MKYILVSQVKCLAFIIFCLASDLACVRHQPDDLADDLDAEAIRAIAAEPHNREDLIDELKLFPNAREYEVDLFSGPITDRVDGDWEVLSGQEHTATEKTVDGRYIVTQVEFPGAENPLIMVVTYDKHIDAYKKWVLLPNGIVHASTGVANRRGGLEGFQTGNRTIAWISNEAHGEPPATFLSIECHSDDEITWQDATLQDGKVIALGYGDAVITKRPLHPEGQDGVSTEEVNPFAAFADDADPSGDGETNVLSPTPNNPQAKVDETAVQAAVAALKKLRARIKRNDNGDVQALDLSDTQITDAGLEHLKGLTELKTLVLHGTKITGAGLVHLKGLAKLQSLGLADTQITDAGLEHLKGLTELETLNLIDTKITGAGLEHLKGLTSLQTLVFDVSKITDAGLEHLKGLTSLQTLGLGSAEITDAGLVHLKGLTELETLNLSRTQITDAGLVHLKGLQLTMLSIPKQTRTDLGLKHYLAARETPTGLNLGRWSITDAGLEHLKGLAKLQSLVLDGTKITNAGLVHLKGLTELETLVLRGTKITDAGVAELQKALPNCKLLNSDGVSTEEANSFGEPGSMDGETDVLSATPNNPQAKVDETAVQAAVAALKKLGAQIKRNDNGDVQSLEIPGKAGITDAGLEHLKGLTSLQALSLSGTQITDAGLVHLKGLTKLQSLMIVYTKITDAGLVYLRGLTELETLNLSGTKITDAGLEHLKGLTKLQSLILVNTQITDAGLVHLKGLTELETLNLFRNQITDAGLEHLKGLTKLEKLTFGSAQITDAGLVHLKGLTKLQSLWLIGTQITDAGVAELQKALPNCKIQ